MPRALYAISYQQTGLVLSFCELAKQDLSKAGAVQALLDQLIGAQLQVSLELLLPPPSISPTVPIKIDKAQLNVDEVNVDPKDIPKITDYMTACLQRFVSPPTPPASILDLLMLDLSDATAKAGDGTVKKLIDPTQLKTTTISLQKGTAPANGLLVGSPATFAAGTRLQAIIDGQPQAPFDVPMPPVQVLFPYTAGVNTWHTVVLATRGYKPFFGLMQAQ